MILCKILLVTFIKIGLISAFNIENIGIDDVLQLLIPTTRSSNPKCQNHSIYYMQELKNLKLWATEMFDASSKFPSGVLYGSSVDFGNFDECIEVKIPFDSDESVAGKYCMAKFHITPPEYTRNPQELKYHTYDPVGENFNISTWEKVIAFSKDRSLSTRDEFYFSYCLPSSCQHEDLEKTLKELANHINSFSDFQVSVSIDKKLCQIQEEISFSTPDLIFIGVVAVAATIAVLATFYDWFTRLEDLQQFKLNGVGHDVITSFSIWSNIKKLNKTGNDSDNLTCIHGLKTMSMFFVIFGHRIMFGVGSPLVNPSFIEQFYGRLDATVLLNGPIIVDTFFNISGFLACYLMLKELDRLQKGVNFFIVYLHRFIRLTPAYAVVLAFYCTVFVKLGSGPLWLERVQVEQDRCLESWWTNLLYINNYINKDQICMFQSWYMTCDMHFFLAAPIIVWMLRRKPTLGLAAIVAIVGLSISVVFVTVYMYNEDGILLLYQKILRDPLTNSTFKTVYIPTHMRASPYFVGMLAGYIKYKIRTTGYKMPKYMVYMGWIMCIIVIEVTVYSACIFYMPGYSYNAIISASYASVHHFTWSVCISWMIIAISERNGEWIEPIVSWHPFVALSKVTYAAYLCHGAIQIYTTATLRQPIFVHYLSLVSISMGDIVLAYIFGVAISMLFEAPILGLEKIIFRKRKSPTIAVNKISIINNE